jgi:ribulose kinase
VLWSQLLLIEDFAHNGCETKKLRIMGGATQSKLWMGILKSVLELPIQKMSITNTCAIGAASIALCASNYFTNYKEAAAALISSENIEDAGYSMKYYRNKYNEFQRLLAHMLTFYK